MIGKSVPIIDRAVTEKMAKLAQISLTEEEINLFTPQLANIVGYISQLSEVDVSGVVPSSQSIKMTFEQLRNDEVLDREPVVAPGTPFEVPSIL